MVLFSLFEVANTCGGAVEEINYSLWILASEVKKARNRKQKIVFFLAIASHVFHHGYSLSAANYCSVYYWDRERDVQVVNCMHLLIIYMCACKTMLERARRIEELKSFGKSHFDKRKLSVFSCI